MNEKFIIHNGDVRSLKVYRLATIVSVITEVFVDRFISRGSRTTDQMQQAARSCKQNIVEGSAAAPTSKETEIKLTNVARASLSELEEDYIDYLRFKQLSRWEKGHPRLDKLRTYLCSPRFESEYRELVCRLPAEEFCNLAITLIRQTQYLLDKLLESQQRRFLESGGIREAMSRARREYRSNHSK
ncbi:MAG: four helix bundle suffix domain-containing protein [Muribaculaceae bacterium]|nr:four helix bundle suffix domain-containing protein [Muribaculaceae bacterium]